MLHEVVGATLIVDPTKLVLFGEIYEVTLKIVPVTLEIWTLKILQQFRTSL